MKSNKCLVTGTLWGELPSRETPKQEIITPDIIENVWRQVIDESDNSDSDYQIDRHPEYIEFPMGNLHVLNTINLHQQLRTMDDGTVLSNVTVIEAEDSEDTKEPANPFHFLLSRDRSGESKGVRTIQGLAPRTKQDLLRHAVVTLLAHVGFEKSSDTAIETLLDIADHFLRRMALLLKVAVEQNDHGFPDAIERVMLETGVGGVAALHDYYQESVVRLEATMKKRVEDTAEKQRMVLDEAASKLQFEELDEFGNVYKEVPTLQLLDPEMGFPPSLDAGFQMLYNLEQDELNSLDVEEEEVNVSDSPNTGQRSDATTEKKN